MTLQNDFFRILAAQTDNTAAAYTIALNADHFIFKAHFPGNPITPGVCQLGIVEELMSELKGQPLRISHINSIKYMHLITPTDHATFDVQLTRVQAVGDGYSVQCLLKDEVLSFTKMSLILSPKQ